MFNLYNNKIDCLTQTVCLLRKERASKSGKDGERRLALPASRGNLLKCREQSTGGKGSFRIVPVFSLLLTEGERNGENYFWNQSVQPLLSSI